MRLGGGGRSMFMATEKQKRLLHELVENGGSVSGAMRKVGYSENTAKTPSKVTKSKAFVQYMEEAGVTDQKLVKVISEGLDATKAVVMGRDSQESFVDVQPDFAIRHKYLETALKVKGVGLEIQGNQFIQVVKEQVNKYV